MRFAVAVLCGRGFSSVEAVASLFGTIKRALEGLEAREFVLRDDDYTSYYRITERGRRYLSGELDASELERDE